MKIKGPASGHPWCKLPKYVVHHNHRVPHTCPGQVQISV